MGLKTIAPIPEHYTQARGRLHQFVKDIEATLTIDGGNFNGWEAMVHAFVSPSQGLEDVMNSMLAGRSINNSTGVNLDRIGQIVGAVRGGLPDDLYLNRILAQIFANNSNTTAKDLLSVVSAMSGEDLQLLELTEAFPARVQLNYLLETPIVVDGTNNTLDVRITNNGPFEPLLIPQGTYFPYELSGLTEGTILSAPSWLNPIEVSWDPALRKFTFHISDAYPLGHIRLHTYGPVVAFAENAELLGVATSSSSVPAPPLDPTVLLSALNQAKAAGVEVATAIQTLGDSLVFSNTVEGLGFASLQAIFTWQEIQSYVYLELGVAADPTITFSDTAGEFYFEMWIPTANAAGFVAELKSLNTGDGGVSFFDPSGGQVNYFGPYRIVESDQGGGQWRVRMYVTDTPSAIPLGVTFLNSVPVSYSAMVANMSGNFWSRDDKVAFESLNPLRLGKGAIPAGGANVGGGTYTTILT